MSSLAATSAARPVSNAALAALARRTTIRSLGTKQRVHYPEETAPPHALQSVKPPNMWAKPNDPKPDPMAYIRKPVTSAHAIDTQADPPRLSARDSAALGPSGMVVHGRYGELGVESATDVPLEYQALLHKAAEGAAGLRVIVDKSGGGGNTPSTVLVYGATQPNALATVQLAATSGHAVVAVVGGEASGNDDMVDVVKGLACEPGTAVKEEYAIVKSGFRDLVRQTSMGDDPSNWTTYDPDSFLEEFKKNLLDYVATYPDTLPAAVSPTLLEFKGKEKDRKHFRDNLDTYLSQFPPGAAPIDPARLDAYFTKEQYAIWKAKFLKQTTRVISGDDDEEVQSFEPTRLVRDMINTPEQPEESLVNPKAVDGAGPYVPYEFSVLNQTFADGVEPKKGGPVVGAVIAVTPELKIAAEAVEAAGPNLRAKAEALQFLTESQRNAFAAASSVVSMAKENNGTIVVVGGTLPGLDTVEPTDADVQVALDAMELDENGEARLNYWVQVYRAGDWPVYADYAIHRATEALAGPRQIIVTK